MAVDFKHLLKRPAGQAKRPAALPIGDYPAIVKNWESGDNNKNKTPYVRFHLGLLDWPEGVDERDKQQEQPDGTLAAIDLSKRQQRRDFFLTDDALFRLDEFIASCGIDASGREYAEVLPEVVGKQVLVEVQQYVNQNDSSIGNQIGKVVGTEG
jgi:hypothetical protein